MSKLLPVITTATFLTLGLTSGDAFAMRCQSKIISEGDTLYRVKSLCGAPDYEDRRYETRTERRSVRGPCRNKKKHRQKRHENDDAQHHSDASHEPSGQRHEGGKICSYTEERTIEVVVDELVYDFGSHKFVRHLLFEQGRLKEIRTGSYGEKD